MIHIYIYIYVHPIGCPYYNTGCPYSVPMPEYGQARSQKCIPGRAKPHKILRLKCNEYKLVY